MSIRCNSILIVDDEESICDALCELLTIEGYEKVAAAHNGEQALEKLSVMDKPCLILLDLKMPNMGGYEFIEHIKERGMQGVTHIVLMTALPKKELKSKDYTVITKPMEINNLIKLVNDICEKK